MSYSIPSVLTVAGSDSSGGAGIQADIKTVESMGLYAQSVITALTAQNTLGVYGVFDVAPDFVCAQMDAVFGDIRPQAVKVGMVSSTDIVSAVARGLSEHAAPNVVFDPLWFRQAVCPYLSRGHRRFGTRAVPACVAHYAQYSRGGSVMRHGNRNASRYGIGSADTVRHDVWRGSRERRAWCNRRRRPAVSRGVVPLAERQARRNGEYAWNRLHAVERNSVRARIGKRSFRSGASGETLRFRGSSRRFRHGEGKRAARSHVGASRGLWLA